MVTRQKNDKSAHFQPIVTKKKLTSIFVSYVAKRTNVRSNAVCCQFFRRTIIIKDIFEEQERYRSPQLPHPTP
jgi:hypothetical protein